MGRESSYCIIDWHCPVQDLSFLLALPRGCCHATQCGTHIYTLTHAHTSSNNGLLYEVPTDAMVTSSFWARRTEWCAKKMPWFLFSPLSQTTLPRNLLKLNKWKPVGRQITMGVSEGERVNFGVSVYPVSQTYVYPWVEKMMLETQECAAGPDYRTSDKLGANAKWRIQTHNCT